MPTDATHCTTQFSSFNTSYNGETAIALPLLLSLNDLHHTLSSAQIKCVLYSFTIRTHC